MPKDLWGNQIPRSRKPRNVIPLKTPVSTITDNDCEIFGHTLRSWDLAGCNVCQDCGVKIFCLQCIEKHSNDPQAVPILCPRHEESQVSA